jgi:hypothetical protein
VNTKALIVEIDKEIARLKEARSLLAGENPSSVNRPRKKLTMSPEGVARIAAAQRKRWAALRKDEK